jgi:hypothetical protein
MNNVAEECAKRHGTTAGVVEEESEDGVVSERPNQNLYSLSHTAFRQLQDGRLHLIDPSPYGAKADGNQ